MHPVIQVGSITLSTYLCSMVLILLGGLALAFLLWRRDRGNPDHPPRAAAFGWLMLFPLGLVGARVFFLIQHPGELSFNPLDWSGFQGGGMAAWGPYLAWVAGGFLLGRTERPGSSAIWRAADIFLPAVLAAHVLWRSLCCFLAGCCHGRPAFGFPLAVTFNDPGTACIYRGIPVHPTQLYEAAGVLLILLGILWLGRRARPPGTLVWTWFIGYGVLRFCVEFLRGDDRGMITSWLSMNQGVSLFFVALSAWMLLRRRHQRLGQDTGAGGSPAPPSVPRA